MYSNCLDNAEILRNSLLNENDMMLVFWYIGPDSFLAAPRYVAGQFISLNRPYSKVTDL